MEVTEKTKGVITLDKLYVRNISFRRNSVIKDYSYKFNIDKELTELGNGAAILSLTCHVSTTESEDLELDVTIEAELHLEDDGVTWELMEPNAMAIMFPFLRSQVAIITAQPGLPSIVFPTVNINALLADIEED